MESQSERVPGGLVVYSNVESMVQDTPEQDINVQEQFLPQPNPEPEMGAAAAEAAMYDTPPPSPPPSNSLPNPRRIHA